MSLLLAVPAAISALAVADSDHYCQAHYPKRETAHRLVDLVNKVLQSFLQVCSERQKYNQRRKVSRRESSINGKGLLLRNLRQSEDDGQVYYVNKHTPEDVLKTVRYTDSKLCHYNFQSHLYFPYVVVVAANG